MDAGRTEVYAAEAAAFEGTDLEVVRPVAEVTAAIESVTAGEWWPGPHVVVTAARSDARSSCARDLGTGSVEIRLATPQATLATAAHELGHALAGVSSGHGPSFRRATLDVVEAITNLGTDRRGRLHVDQLSAAFDAMNLAVGERRWPRPTSAGPFAL